jgi:hypothetical protein
MAISNGLRTRLLTLLACALFMPGALSSQGSAALPPLTGTAGFGFMIEKGVNYARFAPVTRSSFAYSFDLGAVDLLLGDSLACGALFGQVSELGLEAACEPRWSRQWKPSLGLGLFLDFGSTIYTADSAASAAFAPPGVMSYFGVNIRPLVFVGPENATFSFLDSRIAMSFYDFPRSFRFETSLLSVGVRADAGKAPEQAPSKEDRPQDLEFGVSQSTFVAYQWIAVNWGAASLRLEGNWHGLEAGLGASMMSMIGLDGVNGFSCEADLGFAPRFPMGKGVAYQPRIALGCAYVYEPFPALYAELNSESTYFLSAYAQAEFLRFSLDLGRSPCRLLLSGLELRMAPVYSDIRPSQYGRGAFIAQCTLLRVGLRFGPGIFAKAKGKGNPQ